MYWFRTTLDNNLFYRVDVQGKKCFKSALVVIRRIIYARHGITQALYVGYGPEVQRRKLILGSTWVEMRTQFYRVIAPGRTYLTLFGELMNTASICLEHRAHSKLICRNPLSDPDTRLRLICISVGLRYWLRQLGRCSQTEPIRQTVSY